MASDNGPLAPQLTNGMNPNPNPNFLTLTLARNNGQGWYEAVSCWAAAQPYCPPLPAVLVNPGSELQLRAELFSALQGWP